MPCWARRACSARPTSSRRPVASARIVGPAPLRAVATSSGMRPSCGRSSAWRRPGTRGARWFWWMRSLKHSRTSATSRVRALRARGSSAARCRLKTTSARPYSLGSTPRAFSVDSWKSGTSTTALSRRLIRNGRTMLLPPSETPLATAPPQSAAARLSGWFSICRAASRSCSWLRRRARYSLASTTPAAMAVALLPRPRPNGTGFLTDTLSLGIVRPGACIFMHARALCHIRLLSHVETSSAPSPS
mmetsp:Transcript_11798/g.25318  ORF Transcript_11798/g.25318 Transcript_11798/m.25318 type:complete len:246 (-) Transcript_11798:257-994(-)